MKTEESNKELAKDKQDVKTQERGLLNTDQNPKQFEEFAGMNTRMEPEPYPSSIKKNDSVIEKKKK